MIDDGCPRFDARPGRGTSGVGPTSVGQEEKFFSFVPNEVGPAAFGLRCRGFRGPRRASFVGHTLRARSIRSQAIGADDLAAGLGADGPPGLLADAVLHEPDRA